MNKIALIIFCISCLNAGHLYGQTLMIDAPESNLYTLYECICRESPWTAARETSRDF